MILVQIIIIFENDAKCKKLQITYKVLRGAVDLDLAVGRAAHRLHGADLQEGVQHVARVHLRLRHHGGPTVE